MRKFFITIVLISTSILCSAQITRNIWGLELGRSNEQQVMTILKQKGFNPEMDKGTNSISIKTEDFFMFGGGYWSYASFSFHNGKLYMVHFHNNEYKIPIGISEMFMDLNTRIEAKYGKYKRSDSTTTEPVFYDGKTILFFGLGLNGSVNMIYMQYYDENLWEKTHESADNEL